jgi:propionyl-CoA carboxylase beta chain
MPPRRAGAHGGDRDMTLTTRNGNPVAASVDLREATGDGARTRAATPPPGEAESRAEKARARQHALGKLTARERVALLVDDGSFVELDALARSARGSKAPPGDAVITGHGTVDGRTICVFAQDFTVLGGSVGETVGRKITKVMDLAMEMGCPLIALNDSGGARIQEGVAALAYYAEIGRRAVSASGIIPQISLILGPCAGGAAYHPALTDIIVMTNGTAQMFVTGPDVVQAATGEVCTIEELGGAETNLRVSGNAHYVATDDADAIAWTRDLLSYLPSTCHERAPGYGPTEPAAVSERDMELDAVVPREPRQGYDMRAVVSRLVDDGDLLEIQAGFGRSIICGLARIDGQTVGVVASQPMFDAGTLNIDSSEKAARFVRFCDAFNVPILTLVDAPGYTPGRDQERLGIIRRGAKLLHAYAETTVPTVTVVIRKAYGGAYAALGSKHLGIDVNLAWPTSEIGVMGSDAAIRVLHGRTLAAIDDPADREARREQLVNEHREAHANPYEAAELGFIDEVIVPHDTRRRVATAFRRLEGKVPTMLAKKHGNIPL